MEMKKIVLNRRTLYIFKFENVLYTTIDDKDRFNLHHICDMLGICLRDIRRSREFQRLERRQSNRMRRVLIDPDITHLVNGYYGSIELVDYILNRARFPNIRDAVESFLHECWDLYLDDIEM